MLNGFWMELYSELNPPFEPMHRPFSCHLVLVSGAFSEFERRSVSMSVSMREVTGQAAPIPYLETACKMVP